MRKTKSKYTKGPWRLCAIENGHRGISSDDGKWWSFAKVAVETCNVSDGVGIANANLIVAAPELLEALEQLVKQAERHEAVGIWYDEARAAIAKAKGNNVTK